ncbi:effector-associated constant component EACC1 [Streptomyces huiliensis]|uniref:effector-associated constant component EACC1 n=1 Tax=Streptomyces huiliensis TaxID=2876027 RepID=UPI001CC18D5A|nr:hypothetical protein [Streptomyces huiliensis]MBZ4323590.1 hypothetical protein [Streptomyces huiliensis]
MEITLSVTVQDGDPAGALSDLRHWLLRDPHLRHRVGRESAPPPPTDWMGAADELLPLLLAPGGVTAAAAAAVVAWVRSRRGDQKVTIDLPDGTRMTVAATQVRDLDAKGVAELVEHLAATLNAAAGERPRVPAGEGADPVVGPAVGPVVSPVANGAGAGADADVGAGAGIGTPARRAEPDRS